MIQFPDLGLMNNPDFDPRTRAWFQNAMKTPDKVIIANPHQAASTGEWVVNISKKIEKPFLTKKDYFCIRHNI